MRRCSRMMIRRLCCRLLLLHRAASVRQRAPVEMKIQKADVSEVKSVKAELVQVTDWNGGAHQGLALLSKSGGSTWMEGL